MIISNNSFQEDKLNENNRDFILKDIHQFLYLYLFKGNVTNVPDVVVENLFDLPHDDLILIKIVHFLLSDEIKDLIKVLPNLIRNLSHSTKNEQKEFKGVINGHIDWNNTLKQRLITNFNDKSLYVCNPSSKFYDLEENQLLKFLLRKIVYLKNEYLEFFNSDILLDIENNKTEDWQSIIDTNFNISKKVLKKVYFEEITSINSVSAKHLRKTYKNRNPLYHKVAKAFILYEDLFILNRSDILNDLIEKRVIVTLDDDKLFELYILFNLIKILPKSTIDLKLVYNKNEYVAEAWINDYLIRFYYQKIPNILKNESKYLHLLNKYQINKKVKIPDIIIEFEKNNKFLYRLIEVKNSSDSNYIRNSLYKVFGYYKDFEGIDVCCLIDKFPVILIMWSGIKLNKNYDPFNDEIIIFNRQEFLSYLNKLIEC